MTRGHNAPRYTYSIRMWVLWALIHLICGCMASCRGNSGKRHVVLVQCIGLICIISELRYRVVMLTVQALLTSASDTYPVDCGDKNHEHGPKITYASIRRLDT